MDYNVYIISRCAHGGFSQWDNESTLFTTIQPFTPQKKFHPSSSTICIDGLFEPNGFGPFLLQCSKDGQPILKPRASKFGTNDDLQVLRETNQPTFNNYFIPKFSGRINEGEAHVYYKDKKNQITQHYIQYLYCVIYIISQSYNHSMTNFL